MDEKERILQEIRRVARAIEPAPLTRSVFRRNGTVPESKVRYYFGSWNRAVEAAGLHPNPPNIPVTGYKKISDDELLEAIGNLWRKIGRKPTEDLMNSEGAFSIKPYRSRWGTFRAAIDAYIQKYGVPLIEARKADEPEKLPRSAVVIPKTYKPIAQPQKRRN